MTHSVFVDTEASESALVLVDLQCGFLKETGRMPVDQKSVESLIASANAIANDAESFGVRIVHLTNAFAKRDIANYFRNFSAIKGSAGAEIDDRIQKRPHVRIEKAAPDGFSNPELDMHFRNNGISKLFIGGVFAEGCVRATTLSALKRGYRVAVLSMCTASDRYWKTAWALGSLRRRGAYIVNSKIPV